MHSKMVSDGRQSKMDMDDEGVELRGRVSGTPMGWYLHAGRHGLDARGPR